MNTSTTAIRRLDSEPLTTPKEEPKPVEAAEPAPRVTFIGSDDLHAILKSLGALSFFVETVDRYRRLVRHRPHHGKKRLHRYKLRFAANDVDSMVKSLRKNPVIFAKGGAA